MDDAKILEYLMSLNVIFHNSGKNLSQDFGEVLIKFSPRSSLDLNTVIANDHALKSVGRHW